MVTAKLISAFVFATRIVQSLFYLNPKFQVSSHLLWLYIPVCVRPGRKPQRPVFSERGSLISPCNTKTRAEVSSGYLLSKLGIQEVHIELCTSRICCFEHVEHSTDWGLETVYLSRHLKPRRETSDWIQTGAVVSVADYGSRVPWCEDWPGHHSLWH